MKKLFTRLAALTLGLTASAQAQLINDNFNTAPANPNDLSWYSSASTVATFSAATGALQITSPDANVSVFKQFTPTTLAVGQVLQASFTYTAFANQPTVTANTQLRIGLFDTNNTFSSNQGLTPWNTSNEGYQMTIGGGSATATSNFFYRSGNSGIVSTTSSTALGTADTLTQFSFTSVPTTVSFSIARTATSEITINGFYNQGAGNVNFTQKLATLTGNYVDTFDTFYVGFGTAATNRGFTIDNVSLTVVPEPTTTAGVLAAFLGLLLLVRRAHVTRRG